MDFENKILSREISQLLWEAELTLSTAESCTGGRVAESIIAIPGASKYFKGGVISYTDEIKRLLLDVPAETLDEHTAVSEETAKAMVSGACRRLNTDYAIAVTGYAGPTGGTKETPVGTIWIACGTATDASTLCLTEDYGRDINLSIATHSALQHFLEYLKADIARKEAASPAETAYDPDRPFSFSE